MPPSLPRHCRYTCSPRHRETMGGLQTVLPPSTRLTQGGPGGRGERQSRGGADEEGDRGHYPTFPCSPLSTADCMSLQLRGPESPRADTCFGASSLC